MPKSEHKLKNTHNIRIGRWGEQMAAEYLQSLGYALTDRNLHTPYGELDLIVTHEDQTIFVEVKTRSNLNMGYPEEALTPRKKSHLLQAIAEVMADRTDLPQNWRMDLIAILGKPGDPNFQLEHFENVASD